MAWQDVKRLVKQQQEIWTEVKESLEEKKNSISEKVLQRLTPKPKNFIQTPKLKQFAGEEIVWKVPSKTVPAPLFFKMSNKVLSESES